MDIRTSFFLVILLVSYGRSYRDEDYQQASSEDEQISELQETFTELSKPAEYVAAGKYTIYTEAKSWLEAMLLCWAKKRELAVPRTPEDAAALGRLLASAMDNITDADMLDAVHVGLTDEKVEGDWWTVYGSSVAATGYNNWLGGRIEPNTSADCAALLADGHYIQQSCEARLAYACEPQPKPTKRSDGYVDVADIGTFKLHMEPLTWPEASRRCAEEGATLAVPKSERAAGLLAGTLVTAAKDEKVSREGFFVGINDLAAEGVWRTVLDETLASSGFSTWSPGQPSGGREENCGALLADGRFGDYPCSRPIAFSCELGGPQRKVDEAFATLGRYSIFPETGTWLYAALACRRRNATLAVPKNSEELNILYQLALKMPRSSNEIYLGDIYNGNGGFLQPKRRYRRVYYDYEYHADQERCLSYDTSDKNVYRSYCSDSKYYICEYSSNVQ